MRIAGSWQNMNIKEMINQDPKTRVAEGLTFVFATMTLADWQTVIAMCVGVLAGVLYLIKILERLGVLKQKIKDNEDD
jgi:hypothetical protein